MKDFKARLKVKFANDSEKMSMSEWIIQNTHLKKRPFSFKGYEFQQQIADDMHPDLVCIKCSQVGLSEIQIRKFLGFLKRNTAVTGIFTLPTDEMFKRLSSTRVKPLLETEPVFNQYSGSQTRNTGLYQIDESYGYFVGNKESDATSIPADLKFHDELDLSDQDMISLFTSRLQNSSYKISQSFSTPTFIGYGVDGRYQVSDQHEYLLRCPHCRHYNIPDFTPQFITIPGLKADLTDLGELTRDHLKGVDLDEAYIRCESCGNPIDRNDPAQSEWVPKFPGAKTRGYKVRPLCTTRISIKDIVDNLFEYKERGNIRRWHNTTLGNPFNDENVRLTEPVIRTVMVANKSQIEDKSVPTALGIDVGHTCHLVKIALNNKRPHVYSFETIRSDDLEERVEQYLKDYNIVTGCIDRHPETTLANSIRDLSGGRILPVEYRGNAILDLVKDELENITHVQGNRTIMIDNVAEIIRRRQIQFSGYGDHERLVLEHLQDMVRIENEEKQAIWNKLKGIDHFFHALAYGLFSIRLRNALDYLSEEEEVRTTVLVSQATLKDNTKSELGYRTRVKEGSTLWHQ